MGGNSTFNVTDGSLELLSSFVIYPELNVFSKISALRLRLMSYFIKHWNQSVYAEYVG
jgi:hypothetical protein